ncbi:hypothetical protein SD37_10525 [Amycolatopsis orientalis]|uniref:NADH:flavin oxidoreductase/NADH oxidase N-terminal domain-containing protein n=1 Tax=Amycolatopsis orientalis TaxID=31958 RepID=A0A193BUY6_AMYOR|nr:hypothetical protein [Amycolatopsis orientalis]ANN16031.1 hypothetical protein SD37_10525 [Amycolatopsis orientalis]
MAVGWRFECHEYGAFVAEFDGEKVHGVPRLTLCQFLLSLSNQRDDERGGDTERRMRVVIEVT